MSKTFGKALIPIIGVFLVIFAVSNGRADEELNIYSARHYDTDLMLYERFTEETGIKLNLIEGEERRAARAAEAGRRVQPWRRSPDC